MELSPAKLFEDACYAWGEYRLSPIPAGISKMFESQREYANTQIAFLQKQFLVGMPIRIYFDYVNSEKMQAVADVRNSIGFIGIYMGAIIIPMDTICRMLSHPGVLQNIGDRNKESVQIQHSEGLFWDFGELLEYRRKSGYSPSVIVPRDEIRAGFAIFSSQFTRDFLVLHELAHIVLGHCEWSPRHGIPFILEAASSRQSNDPITDQALEMQADGLAVGISLDRLIKTQMPEEYSEFGATAEQRLFCWCFGIAVLFRLFGMRVDHSKLGGSDHPPSGMRFVMALMTAKAIIQELAPEISDEFVRICNRATAAVESAISLIGGTGLTKAEVDSLYHPSVAEHYLLLVAKLNSIIPELKEFRHLS